MNQQVMLTLVGHPANGTSEKIWIHQADVKKQGDLQKS